MRISCTCQMLPITISLVFLNIIPRRESASKRCPEAGYPSLSSPTEGLCSELGLWCWVNPPEWPFAWLLLGTRHFDEIPVQWQVVTNGVLKQSCKQLTRCGLSLFMDKTLGRHWFSGKRWWMDSNTESYILFTKLWSKPFSDKAPWQALVQQKQVAINRVLKQSNIKYVQDVDWLSLVTRHFNKHWFSNKVLMSRDLYINNNNKNNTERNSVPSSTKSTKKT